MFKIPHLTIPFYWDECWPYVPAIKELYRNGLSLLPNAIDPNLSRGHPLFYHNVAAIWMHAFGTSNLSLHSFALSISLLFLITIFEAGYRIYNARVATIAVLLVATHVSFFVQSSFVIFEILVAFLAFLAIYLYVKEKYIACTLVLSALFLTKESGLIAGFVIGMDGIITFINKEIPIQKRIIKLLPVTVACIAAAAFFLLQKHITGWFVLPLYSETILTKWPDIWYRFGTAVVQATFCEDYSYILYISLAVFLLAMLLKQRKTGYFFLLLLVLQIVIAYYSHHEKVVAIYESKYLNLAGISVFFILSYLFLLYYFSKKTFFSTFQQRKMLLLSAMFVLCFLFFSSVAYFIPRYLLTAIVPSLFVLAVVFDLLIRHSFVKLYYPLIIIVLFTGYLSFTNSKGTGDGQMEFTKGMQIHVGVVEFMERSNFYDKIIVTNSFLHNQHLSDPNTGFLSSQSLFTHIGSTIDSLTEIVIYDNIDRPENVKGSLINNPSFELIYSFSAADKWSEIYRRKCK